MTYVKNLRKFLVDYMDKASSTIQSATVNAKRISAFVNAVHAHVQSCLLEMPDSAPEKLGVFDMQIQNYIDHKFTGTTNFGAGEVWVLLSGSISVGGMSYEKAQGTSLMAKLKHLQNMKVEACEALTDYWCCELKVPGQIVAIPSGSLLTVAASDALLFRWGFGCTEIKDLERCLWMMQQLLAEFPALANDNYAAWLAWLGKIVAQMTS